MKKFSKFKKGISAFLVVNGFLGWIAIFLVVLVGGGYAQENPVSDEILLWFVVAISYGATSFLMAMIYVALPLMEDAMKGDKWYRYPERKWREREATNYQAYHDERSDKRNTIDILIVGNNIFWIVATLSTLTWGCTDKFLPFACIALASTVPTIIFVVIPISKYLSARRPILRGGDVYKAGDDDDIYRMK
ncbi:MAG: hypothetical protein R3Y32_05325 [Bacillota bacterium]